MIILLDMSFSTHIFGNEVHLDTNSINMNSTDGYAVLINTYNRRDILGKSIKHYSLTCGKRYGVGKIFIVWPESDVLPHLSDMNLLLEDYEKDYQPEIIRMNNSIGNSKVEIKFLPVEDSLNSRFTPLDGLKGNAIFMVDDDIQVDCKDLLNGYQAWRKRSNSLVGFYPRLASLS